MQRSKISPAEPAESSLTTSERKTTVELGREICGLLEVAEQPEWLVTNGIGGYASGTVSSNLTRINCHGAEDPFAKNTNHSGGTYDVVKDEDGNADDEKTFGECQNCHTDFNPSFAITEILRKKRIPNFK